MRIRDMNNTALKINFELFQIFIQFFKTLWKILFFQFSSSRISLLDAETFDPIKMNME